jgi:hypothetical protein
MESTNGPVSHLMDPVPLFFLELPAEMRNMVYELLFKQESLILLHNVDAFFPKEIDSKDYHKPCEFYNCECGKCEQENKKRSCRYYHDLSAYADAESKDGKELEAMEEEFSYDLSEGLNLLRCCKQIHHEAVGVLYGLNTFAFTRTTSRHDITLYAGGMEDEPEEVYDHHAYNQISYAAHWLNSIGTHYPFLRKVIIDLDATCLSECGDSSWSREVIPLVRVMWDHPEAQCQIVFGHTGRSFPKSFHEGLDENDVSAQDVVTTGSVDETHGKIDLNLVLDALGNRYNSDLRRFSRFLESIDIFTHDGRGDLSVKYKHRLAHMQVERMF